MNNKNFDEEYRNLFDDSDSNENQNVESDINIESSSDNVDLLSRDSDVLDINSYYTQYECEEIVEKSKEKPLIRKMKNFKKNKKAVKTTLKTVLIVFLVCTILGCTAVGAFVGYVLLFIDGTMYEDLNTLKLNYATTIYVENDDGQWVEYQRLHGNENRIWVPYDKDKAEKDDTKYNGIPQNLADAFVAVEDKRFFDHEGIDWRRTASAFITMVTNRTTSGHGGSSITQQLVKNLTDDRDRSATRKLREIMRARYLESEFTKEVILECYMNTIPMGNGLYGVEVAAEYYYGKNVDELTLGECASLAGITNRPEYYRPDTNPKNNKSRRDLVLGLMLEQKLITQKEYDKAIEEELKVVADSSILKVESVNNYFVDALIDEVVVALMDKYGYDKEHAESNFYNGGYKIYSTLNPDIQKTIDKVYQDEKYSITSKKSGQKLQGSMVLMDYEGHVLGMSGGMGKKTTNRGLNRATMSPRQPGSTIKPIAAYAPAIDENLITYSSIVDDNNTTYGKWRPTNWYGYYKGKVTVKYALEISMNTIPVYLVDALTPKASYNFLTQTLGVKNLNENDINYSPLGMGGTNGGLTTLESAAAFAIFGNGGKYYEPTTFTRIYDQYDKLIFQRESNPVVAINADTAEIMNKLLQNVVYGSEGTAAGARGFISNMKMFAKTGTSNDNFNIWFVGGSPYYVASSWCGYDQQEKISDAKRARTMWGAVMKDAHKDLPYKSFPTSNAIQCKLYCAETGHLATTGCPIGGYGWYKMSKQTVCSVHVGESVGGTTESQAIQNMNDIAQNQTNSSQDSESSQSQSGTGTDQGTTPEENTSSQESASSQ